MLARMMKQILFLGALAAPLVLGCNKASTDPCASAFTASASAAITFCETYTKSTVTATTSLPAFATNCSNSKKISSACTCLLGTAASVSRFLFGWMAHLLSIMCWKGTVATTTCTASVYAQITSAVASCTDIVLENISAPASSTIDLTGLRSGSKVTFAGKTVSFYWLLDNHLLRWDMIDFWNHQKLNL